jgi:prevent-host-death family protein
VTEREQIDVEEAKARLDELLERVEQGEEIVIARNGEPVARLVPDTPPPAPRRKGYGSLKGRIDMTHFDDADEEIARLFGMYDDEE